MSKRGTVSVVMLLFSLLTFIAVAQQAPVDTAKVEVDVIWGFKIPLRDGVNLNATIYKPHSQPEPLPVIFTMTPYIADGSDQRAMYFAQHGYVYALVDVRGRGNSAGQFDPFAQEARDGYDVVEFLAKQPWSNGKTGMWGGSYDGHNQWATLREQPPHLSTIVPAASVAPGIDFPMFNGIWQPYAMMWLTHTSGVTLNTNLRRNAPYWQSKLRETYAGRVPFRQLDRLVGNTSTVFSTWIKHPMLDSYWDSMRPSEQQYRSMKIPVLTITGHFDVDQRGALHYYRLHEKYSSAAAQHYLIIGPWHHGGTRTPLSELRGLKFNASSKLDMNALHKEWYDWTMKGGPKPAFLKDRVAYFVMGPNIDKETWKYASSIEAVANNKRVLYLNSDGSANDVFHSGTLSEQPPKAQSTPDHYVYDPLVTHSEDEGETRGFLEQSSATNLRGEGLIYHSAPFAEETEVAGHLKLTLWIMADVPDTDFSVRVTEIRPDGSSIFLADDIMRASIRESLRERKLLNRGEPSKIEFTTFSWFARRIAKGSRLRLIIRALNSPEYEKNFNSGGPVEDETAKDARTAHISVLHDAAHPSLLEVPVSK